MCLQADRKRATRSHAFSPTHVMSTRSLQPSPRQSVDSSPVRSQSRRRGLSWTDCESKVRKLHRAALDEITEDESRRLYRLELSASRHAGKSPRHVLEQAKRIVQSAR